MGLSLLNITAQKLSWAPELGANISLLDNSEIGYNAQFGYYGGLRIRYKLNSKFTLNSGVVCNQKKVRYSQSYEQSNLFLDQALSFLGGGIDAFLNTKSQVNIEGRVNENFLEIPIQLNYNYKRFAVSGGPYIGYLLFAQRNEIKETRFPLSDAVDLGALVGGGVAGDLINSFLPPAYSESTSSSNSINDLNKIDLGASIEIGYEFENYCINVSYAHSFLDYRSNSSEDLKSFRVISISTAYYFDLKKKESEPKVE